MKLTALKTQIEAAMETLRSALAAIEAKDAKRAAKAAKAAKKNGDVPMLPASPAPSDSDNSDNSDDAEAKKPKREASEWGLFIKRVSLVLKENSIAGNGKENMQFASYLKHKKPLADWADSEIMAEKMSWVKPEKAEEPKAEAGEVKAEKVEAGDVAMTVTGDEAKPKKRGRSKALKVYSAVIAAEAAKAVE
jgi:hypothetical protein